VGRPEVIAVKSATKSTKTAARKSQPKGSKKAAKPEKEELPSPERDR